MTACMPKMKQNEPHREKNGWGGRAKSSNNSNLQATLAPVTVGISLFLPLYVERNGGSSSRE